MNPIDPKHPWMRLTAAARTVRDERDVTAPFGFATRVVALAQEVKVASLFERFALRAVGIACLLALASVAVNYKTLAGGAGGGLADDSDVGGNDDAVALVLDLTD
ncbi:MAG: hypothetical protein HZA93_06715 [Verrucomicrobia bacterium]|nr:hypothetical protein [Verrucomicrobiota bacterium]